MTLSRLLGIPCNLSALLWSRFGPYSAGGSVEGARYWDGRKWARRHNEGPSRQRGVCVVQNEPPRSISPSLRKIPRPIFECNTKGIPISASHSHSLECFLLLSSHVHSTTESAQSIQLQLREHFGDCAVLLRFRLQRSRVPQTFLCVVQLLHIEPRPNCEGQP